MEKENKSILFGIIALVCAVLSIILPPFFITIPIILGFLFAIIGLFKDSKKWASVIAIVILVFFGFISIKGQFDTEISKSKSYTVRYEVEGKDFDVSYNNESGGMNNEKGRGYWSKTLILKGDVHAYVTAQNNTGSTKVSVSIYIDGVLKEFATSEGEYSIANVGCFPYQK